MWSHPIYDSCPEAPLPEAVEVHGSFFAPVDVPDGGTSWLLSPARASRVACLMKTCETQRSQLVTGDVTPMTWVMLLAVGMAIGFASGGLLVLQLKH